ncbi:MAG: restriction endonuclease subunit S [Candidatus Gracilibacteria bacterium]|jgi:type I restriction enzyme S subunit
MSEWGTVKIGEFLFERQGRYKPDDKAVANLPRIEKIDFMGKFFIGKKLSRTDMIMIKKGDFVISGINVSKGAMGIYRGGEDVTATIHYSSYTCDKSRIDIDYFEHFLRSAEFTKLLKEQVKGGIKTEIKAKHLLLLEINLPDLDTQKQIAKKLHKIESKNKKLASQNLLQKYQLILLRQSILKDAISGKLTEDWRKANPDVEPASELLKRINLEKERLIKKEKLLPSIEANEVTFELPKGWEWCRLGKITKLITDGKHGDCNNNPSSGFYFLSAKDVQNGKLIYENARQITEEDFSEVHKRTNLEVGDICMVNTGATIGKIAIAQENELTQRTTFQKSVAVIKLIKLGVLNNFAELVLLRFTKDLLKTSKGSAINNLLLGDLKKMLFPLPPVAEQRAIVVKAEKLMGYVSELEKKSAQHADNALVLMKAFLAEAFKS